MLMSQALFIDHEYKADCLNKINYLNCINTNDINDEILKFSNELTIERSKNNEKYLNRTKFIANDIQKIIKEY